MLRLLTETLKNLIRKPATYKFPLVELPMLAEFRGAHAVDLAKCNGCSLCALDCPAAAIEMKLNPSTKKRYPVIDFGRCVFCYQCVVVCPVNAYIKGTFYDLATIKKEELVSDALLEGSGASESSNKF